MNRVKFPFYGLDVVETKNGSLSTAKGVVIRGQRMPTAAYETGQRIRDAKSDGVPVEYDGSRSHVSLLKDAGVQVRTDAIGGRWFIDHLPEPEAYLELRR